jgi:hypothetical protein
MAFKPLLILFACLSLGVAVSCHTLENGTFFVNIPNLYPETSDYDSLNSRLYIRYVIYCLLIL